MDIGNSQRFVLTLCWHLKLSIEITIKNSTVPTYIYIISTHQTLTSFRIERIYENIHVLVQLSLLVEVIVESIDGHVRDADQFVEMNTIIFFQMFLVRAL